MTDSISDKLFQIGGLIPVHLDFGVPIILLWIVIIREFIVVALFSFIDIGDEKVVWYISRYSYVFVGAIRASTVCYFLIPIVPASSVVSRHLGTIGMATYMIAILASLLTLVHMRKASRSMQIRKLIDGAEN